MCYNFLDELVRYKKSEEETGQGWNRLCQKISLFMCVCSFNFLTWQMAPTDRLSSATWGQWWETFYQIHFFAKCQLCNHFLVCKYCRGSPSVDVLLNACMGARGPLLTSLLAPRGEMCPLGGMFTPLFTPRGEYSILFGRMEGQT
jgi:hypothetical protein